MGMDNFSFQDKVEKESLLHFLTFCPHKNRVVAPLEPAESEWGFRIPRGRDNQSLGENLQSLASIPHLWYLSSWGISQSKKETLRITLGSLEAGLSPVNICCDVTFVLGVSEIPPS